ncbi:hypothetical protein V1478_002221, partial [Vespula squamosa]
HIKSFALTSKTINFTKITGYDSIRDIRYNLNQDIQVLINIMRYSSFKDHQHNILQRAFISRAPRDSSNEDFRQLPNVESPLLFTTLSRSITLTTKKKQMSDSLRE